MPLEFIFSQKGNKLLKNDGFLYNRHKINKDSILWKCVLYKEKSCPGTVKTSSEDSNGILLFLF